MATGREARAERLNERLRGAQRVNVGDESFNLDIPGLEIPALPESSPSSRPTPGSSAKRRKLNSDAPASSPSNRSGGSARRSAKTASRSPNTAAAQPDGPPSSSPARRRASLNRSIPSVSRPSAPAAEPESNETQSEEPQPLPVPSSRSSGRPSISRTALVEEIEESPVSKPGSGRRRSVLASSALASSARLRDALGSEGSFPSSPLTRKSRKSEAALSVGSDGRTSRLSLSDEVNADELSVDLSMEQEDNRETSRVHEVTPSKNLGVVEEVDELEGALVPDDDDGAEEISVTEAAKVLGGRRSRSSPQSGSPELGSRDLEAGDDEQDEEVEEAEEEAAPVSRKKPGRPSKSPATQKQPAPKPRNKAPQNHTKPRKKRSEKPQGSPTDRRQSREGQTTAIEVTVQRFVNHKMRRGDNAEDGPDPLQLDVPYANSNRESAVDVFAQVCEEVIGNTLSQFQEHAENADDPARKKEFRIKSRAVEAYREVIRSRLLQHAIHLNHWQGLRKRVRQVQKEKLALREEILRIKAEREQVALRMDAVRVKHEADSKESVFLLNTSNTMHDIDMAVSKGQNAPNLSAKAQKEAELANLELTIAQMTDRVSTTVGGGGMLNQVQDFNAFLERAALALESR